MNATLTLEGFHRQESCNVPSCQIRPNQSLTVGRTAYADHEVELDALMSSVHFSVENFGSYAMLLDLGSTNGTFINGIRTQQATLHDGDVVIAGDTSFVIRIRGSRSPALSSHN